MKELLDLGTDFDEAMEVEVGDNVIRNHPKGKNPGDFLSIALSGSSASHFAMMPINLAHSLLKATLPPGGVCVDPFMGCGSTGIACLKLGGKFIGIDILEQYFFEFKKLLAKF